MYAIYRFCRAVDDIADNVTTSDVNRTAELQTWREAIAALYGGGPSGQAAFLREPVKHFALREQDFLSVIEGMEMDAGGRTIAPDLATLDRYCDCVASAVGRLSIKVFGMDEEPGFALAHHLGRALQLTNILRDLDEDAQMNRFYLPREFLHTASIAIDVPTRMIAHPTIDPVCRGVAELAEWHFREAGKIFGSYPRGDLRPPRLMGAVYSAMLLRMRERGWWPQRQRVRIPKVVLIWLILRYGLCA
jgi:phytoene synthase